MRGVFSTKQNDKHLNEDYPEAREYFKTVCDLIGDRRSILDAACAAGHFLNYAASVLPARRLSGFDLDPALVGLASERNPGMTFTVGDVLLRSSAPERSFDAVTLLGLHSLFDDFKPLLDNAVAWAKPDGAIYFFGPFNSRPVDILTRFRETKNETEPFRVGWNIHAIESVSKLLGDFRSYRFIRHRMPGPLPEDPQYPMRTWKVSDDLFAVGGPIHAELYVLEIIL